MKKRKQYNKKNQRSVGARYEQVAGKYLEEQGYQILQYNYHCRQGEIDIIAREQGYLVFVEVKYRRTRKRGDAAGAVTEEKQKTISRVADYYMMEHHMYQDQKIRFDVVAINGEKMEVLQGAFPYRGKVRF